MSAPLPSPRTARRAGTTLGVALALALAAPAAAFADPADEPREDPRSEQGTAHAQDDRAQSERAKSESGKAGSGKADSGRAAGGDPRGNNGTVKIDGEAFDDGRGNEPHVGCTFQVDFYGFDSGDTATITFTGHAPTGGGLLHSESRTISTDAAGGGQDRDATFTYSVDDQLSELRSITPHAQQGWHVKLAVDVDSAPGGAKQKVFWIDCPAPVAAGAAAPTSTSTGGATTDTGTATGTGTGTTSGTTSDAATGVVTSRSATPTGVLPATLVSGTTVAAAERQDALTLGAAGATLAANDVSAQGSVAPSVLPFTGTQGLVWLLATGLGALGVGALAHRLGRRAAVTTG